MNAIYIFISHIFSVGDEDWVCQKQRNGKSNKGRRGKYFQFHLLCIRHLKSRLYYITVFYLSKFEMKLHFLLKIKC